MLNQPIATERSLAGNHSLVAFTPAGMPAASAMPSRPRKNARLRQSVDQCGRRAGQRPGEREYRKADLGADRVEHDSPRPAA